MSLFTEENDPNFGVIMDDHLLLHQDQDVRVRGSFHNLADMEETSGKGDHDGGKLFI